MVTYAQLQSEAVWHREVTTSELDWLVDELCLFFGVPRGNGGTKGDNRHLNGGHRSQRWILTSRYCTNRGYTVEPGLPAALLDDIAAFDVTLPHQHMLTISRNADRATRAGELEELVEWFGNVDGDERVDGWNNIANRVATSDSSHLWHFHGRIRRSRLRDMTTMRRVFAALTGGTAALEGDDVALNEWMVGGQVPPGYRTDQITQGTVEAPGVPGNPGEGHYGMQQRDTVLAAAAENSAAALKVANEIKTHLNVGEPSNHAFDLDALADKVADRLADKLAARLAS